jgi:hypothetical protein
VAVDDRLSPPYERVLGTGLRFDSARSGEYLAVRDGTLYRGQWSEGSAE